MKVKDWIKSKIKAVRYMLEAVAVSFGFWLFDTIGLQNASEFGAQVSRFIGKKLSVHKLAYKNLSNALPHLTEKEKAEILDDMWDNLGRVGGEYSHVAKFTSEELQKFVKVLPESEKNLAVMRESKIGGIILSAHIANWEVGPKALLISGIKVGSVYRPLNNPYVEKMTASMRQTELITKSARGNRRIIEIIKSGGYVVILADQKVSEGEQVMFFNDTAVTTTSMARIALKYNAPLIPARMIRTKKGFEFIADIQKPLEIERSKNINDNVLKLTLEINRKLESWIREYPAQWFWVHNRWKR